MVKCKKGAAEILCDEPTHLQAKYRAKYTPLEPMQLKVRSKLQQKAGVSALPLPLLLLTAPFLPGSRFVQGKEKPVIVYSVLPYESDAARLEHMEMMGGTGRVAGGHGSGGGPEGGGGGPERPLVGRDEEMQGVLARVAGLVSGSGAGGAIVIEGHTGECLKQVLQPKLLLDCATPARDSPLRVRSTHTHQVWERPRC